MKKFIKFKKEFIFLLIIIAFASFLRLYKLDVVPVSMTDDEIRLVYSGYSIAHSGKDAYGNFLPLVFHITGASTYGQVPIYITSLFFLFLPLSPFVARLPFALSGILSVILIYFIIRKILNNGKIALASAFVLSVSVWSLQLTRFVIEIDIAVALYLSAILAFLYSKKNLKLLLISMFLFFLAFNAYAATKIIFIPLMVVLVWYKFKDLAKRDIVMVALTTILAFGLFAYLSIAQGASSYTSVGGAPFFFLDKVKTNLSVELERRGSIEPNLIRTLYHNKFTYWSRIFSTNYLTAFSPQYLFLDQEASGIYSIWGRGELYLFELPLFFIGAFYLFSKKRKEFFLILMLLLISPLPSAVGINSPTWTARSGFMVFGLYAFVGAGIYRSITLFKDKRYKSLITLIIIVLYIYGVGGYLFQYYYDWSRTNAKYYSKSTKDLVYTTNKYTKEGKKVIISGASTVEFLHFAFYNKINPKIVQSKINQSPVEFDNVIITQGCFINPLDNPYKFIPSGTVYISNVLCKYNVKPTSKITTYQNEEVMWNIYLK